MFRNLNLNVSLFIYCPNLLAQSLTYCVISKVSTQQGDFKKSPLSTLVLPTCVQIVEEEYILYQICDRFCQFDCYMKNYLELQNYLNLISLSACSTHIQIKHPEMPTFRNIIFAFFATKKEGLVIYQYIWLQTPIDANIVHLMASYGDLI